MEKIQDLMRKLEINPIEKSLRAWYLKGCNNKKLLDAEITNPTFNFAEKGKKVMVESFTKTKQASINEEESSQSLNEKKNTNESKSKS